MPGLGSGYIVIGFDRTPESVAALRWALDRAAVMHRAVRIVHRWVPLPATPNSEWRRRLDAVEEVEHEVSTARARMPEPPEVSMVFSAAPVATLLAEQAHRAALVVLGASVPGVVADPARGRVAGPCLERVGCPVVVVDRHGHLSTAQPKHPRLSLVS